MHIHHWFDKISLPTKIIYGLIDPRTNHVRYIGKTTYGRKRIKSHLNKQHLQANTHKAKWLRSLRALGLYPNFCILAVCETETELNAKEREFISTYRTQEEKLTNATDGGEGQLGVQQSWEARIKSSQRSGGRPFRDQYGTIYRTHKEAEDAIGVGGVYSVLKGKKRQVGGYVFDWRENPLPVMREKRPHKVVPVVDQFGNKYPSMKAAALATGCEIAGISRAVRGVNRRTKGWSFERDLTNELSCAIIQETA